MRPFFFALPLGALLDLLLGDPRWLPHPVQGIGWLIGKLEAVLRRCFPTTERGERRAGVWLAALTVGLTGLATGLCLFLAGLLVISLPSRVAGAMPFSPRPQTATRTASMVIARLTQRVTLVRLPSLPAS